MFGIKLQIGRGVVSWVDGLGKRFRRKSEAVTRRQSEKGAEAEYRTEAEKSLAAAMGWLDEPWADDVEDVLDGR